MKMEQTNPNPNERRTDVTEGEIASTGTLDVPTSYDRQALELKEKLIKIFEKDLDVEKGAISDQFMMEMSRWVIYYIADEFDVYLGGDGPIDKDIETLEDTLSPVE